MLHYSFGQKKLICTDPEKLAFLKGGYRKRRYMDKASDTALISRLEGLVITLAYMSFRGDISLKIESGKEALALVDLLEELEIRRIDYTMHLNSVLLRFDNHRPYENVLQIEEMLRSFDGKKCLFKFTRKSFIESWENGLVRFKLASGYNDAGYNIAIRDDELNLEQQLPNLRLILKDGTQVPIENEAIKRSAHSDYYVSCFSTAIDPKLFMMFEADICFIVMNGEEFVEEVIKSYKKQYVGSNIIFDNVDYLDSYRELRANKPVEFLKEFEFSYEKELRFVAFDDFNNTKEIRNIEIDMSKIDYDIVEKKDS